MGQNIDAGAIIESGYQQASSIIEDRDQVEHLLQRLEAKLKAIPVAGGELSKVPVLASLLKSFIQREYTEVPLGTILAIVSAFIYFVSPIDIVPDVIPGVGLADDAAVVAACWALACTDVEEYRNWRIANGKLDMDVFC